MAVKQRSSLTLYKSGAVAAVTEWHFKAASSSSAPTKPTTKTPSAGWYSTVPAWATNTRLYVATRTDLVDGTFLWSDVTEDPTWATAGEAKAKAEETEQYFYADESGAHVVSDLDSAGKAQGYRVDIDSSGIKVSDAKTLDVVATFGAAGATLGSKATAKATLDSGGLTVTNSSSVSIARFSSSGATIAGSGGMKVRIDGTGMVLSKGDEVVASLGKAIELRTGYDGSVGNKKTLVTIADGSFSMKSGTLSVSNASTLKDYLETTMDGSGLSQISMGDSAKGFVRLGPAAAIYQGARESGVGSHLGGFTLFADNFGLNADTRTDVSMNTTYVRLLPTGILVRAGSGSVTFQSPVSAGSVSASSVTAPTAKVDVITTRSGDNVTFSPPDAVVFANPSAKTTFAAAVSASTGSCGLYRNKYSSGDDANHWMVQETDNDLFLGCSRGKYKPYYTKGDVLTWSYIYTSGFITNSSKNVGFVIPLAKPVLGVSSVTASSVNGCKIRQGGKYLYGSGGSTDVKPSSYEAVSINDCIRIKMIFTSTTNVSNNDACGVEWSGKVTFN